MLVAVARSPSRTSSCPVCGRASTQVHSRYERCLAISRPMGVEASALGPPFPLPR